MSKQVTAIIYTATPQINGAQFLKYRKITDSPPAIERFMKFAAKFPGAQYVNFYDRHTRQFLRRIYITQ